MYGFGYQELLALMLILPYLIGAFVLAPYVASAKGRSGFGWLLVALLATPLLALLALAAIPVKPDEGPSDGSEVPEFKWRKD